MRLGSLLAALTLAMVLLASADSYRVLADENSCIAIDAADDFLDAEVTCVPAGTTIEWTNSGRNLHTVTGW